MTEEEWLTATDPTPMLEYVRHTANERKSRLLACALCRYFFFDPHGGDIQSEDFILEPTGWFVDGVFGEDEREVAEAEARELDDYGFYALHKREALIAVASRVFSDSRVWEALERFCDTQGFYLSELHDRGCEYLRCVYGNPFRPVVFDPAWRTSTAIGVAETIYAERTFGDLPFLADALQDAGCEHADILAHLRGPGPHVRGCWALDLVLGKE